MTLVLLVCDRQTYMLAVKIRRVRFLLQMHVILFFAGISWRKFSIVSTVHHRWQWLIKYESSARPCTMQRPGECSRRKKSTIAPSKWQYPQIDSCVRWSITVHAILALIISLIAWRHYRRLSTNDERTNDSTRQRSQLLGVTVRVSVRLSVTSRHCTNTTKHRITQTTPYDSAGTQASWSQKSRRNSNWVTPFRGNK